ncbi:MULTISPECIES: purine/pyrimidine permease [Bacillus]|uniref:purine/pyrimidine permease n=1 Tax=Bacillus TaxID=1386 RepID=UPI00030E18C6|nr:MULTISPECIES: purine/pyrimidine permease [Bacillus]
MKLFLSSVQWVAFMFSSSIVAPIAVAALFQLNTVETAGFIQRAVFILGLAALLQILFGHKLPINEGPAGLWWGVFALYAGLSTTLFTSHLETLQALQGALIAGSIFFILLSAFGIIEKLSHLFTPTVTGVYLLLLVLQLSSSFAKGMMGLGNSQSTVNMKMLLLSVFIVAITIWFTKNKIRFIKQYAILLALVVGWCLFLLFGLAPTPKLSGISILSFPDLFAFGKPIFNTGMIVSALFVTILLIANMIASIRITENILKGMNVEVDQTNVNRTGIISGIIQGLAGMFSTIGSVPISGAGGFIQATGITSKLPFILASIAVVIISFFPPIMSVFAAMPPAVGYSVSFVIFAGMLSMALSDIQKDLTNTRMIIGVSLLSGVGIMFIPTEAFNGLHPVLISLLSNGLIIGTIICICGEQGLKLVKKKYRSK